MKPREFWIKVCKYKYRSSVYNSELDACDDKQECCDLLHVREVLPENDTASEPGPEPVSKMDKNTDFQILESCKAFKKDGG